MADAAAWDALVAAAVCDADASLALVVAVAAWVVAVEADPDAEVAELAAAVADAAALVALVDADVCAACAVVAHPWALAAAVAAWSAASCASTPVPRTITFLRPATDGAGGAATKVIVLPLIVKSWPGICATPLTNTTGMLRRIAAMSMPGVILSQLEIHTMASAVCAFTMYSTESAMRSRLGNE